METDDTELLRAFTREGSQEAFAALARRYAGLLYHAALRLTGRPDLTEEAAQNALAILARKAGSLRPCPSLAPWLHRTVCFEASKLRRRERRYHDRMNHLTDPALAAPEPGSPEDWTKITPHLDEALDDLPEADRQVVLLKYFEGWSCEEMARRLGGEPAAWRQRASRALNRLRKMLARRGVAVPVAVLAGGLQSTLSHAAPFAVTASLTTAPLAAAGTLTWKNMALHTLHMMNTKQLVPAALIIAATLVPLGFQAAAVSRAQARVTELETSAKTLPPASGANKSRAFGARFASRAAAAPTGKEDAPNADGIDIQDLARVLSDGLNADLSKLMQYRMAVSRLDAAGLEALLLSSEALDLPPGHRFALYDKLLSVLASKDPAAATSTGMRLVAGMSGNEAVKLWMNPLPNCLRDWAAKDPAAALAWYEAQKSSGVFEVKSLSDADLPSWMAGGLFTGLMRGDGRKEGIAFFEGLTDEGRTSSLLRFGTKNGHAEDQATILSLAAGISNPGARATALMGVVGMLGQSDLAAAGTFIASAGLPDSEVRKLLVAAASAPVSNSGTFDTAARLTWLREQTPATQRDKSIGYFLGTVAGRDQAGIRQQVDAEIAGGASEAFLGAFIRNAAQRSNAMDLAFSYFPRLTDPAERARTLREIQAHSPEAARTAALQAGITATEMDTALQTK
jgi:RNA polymerase sigma factor (sigma-70 family)